MNAYDEAVDAKIDAERKRQIDIKQNNWSLTRAQQATVDYEGWLLKNSEVYIWTPHMIKLMMEAAAKLAHLQGSGKTTLTPAMLKSLSGWWWLGRQSNILVRSKAEWFVKDGQVVPTEYPDAVERRRLHGVLFGNAAANNGLYIGGYTYDHLEPSGLMVPISSTIWPYGRSLDDQLEHIATDVNRVKVRDGKAYADPADVARIYSDQKVCAMFFVGTLLMNQKLLKLSQGLVSRGTRRRAERQGYVSKVQIVNLRRHEYVKHQTEEQAREWDWQWIVRGHWRSQEHLGQDKLPIWIDPYVKGPEDKPLKPSAERIFLVRE